MPAKIGSTNIGAVNVGSKSIATVKKGLTVVFQKPSGSTGGWDLSTATYDNVSFDISGQAGFGYTSFFKPDGSKLYVAGVVAEEIYQYSLATNWDVGTASYDNVSFITSSQTPRPYGLHFKPDGTKMYIAANDPESILQYSLSTPWDLNTVSYSNKSLNIVNEVSIPTDLFIKSDGTKMYVIDLTSTKIYQYTLSTPWDLSTASFDNVSFSVSGQDSSPFGIHFKPDGIKMFVIGRSNNKVSQYTLGTAWDIGTASYNNVNKDVGIQSTSSRGVTFKTDGTKMYINDNTTDTIYQYSLN